MSPVAVSLQQILDLASHYSPRSTPDMRKRAEIGNDLAAELGSVLPGLAVSLGLTDLGLRTEPEARQGSFLVLFLGCGCTRRIMRRAPKRGLRCQTIRTAGPGGRIPAGGARVTPAIMPQPGPVPRDRVTPPCCGRGSVTRSFSCRRRWHRQQHWPHRSQINGGFDCQAAGRVGTTPSIGAGGPQAPPGSTRRAR
jgi:hypothetical protein